MSFTASINASGFISITAGGITAESGMIPMATAFFPSGLNASANVAGTIGNFLATAFAVSGVNTSAAVAQQSGIFVSGIINSAPIIMDPPSTFASAGSALVSIGFLTGAQTSYVMFVSVGSAGQVFALTTSGVLSTNAVNALSLTVSTINGSPPAGATSTFSSGGTFSALVSMETSLHVASGINSSGPIQGASGLLQSGADVSAVIKVGTSILVSGDINASQITARGAVSIVGSIAVGGSGLFSGGLSTTNINASTFNGNPLTTGTSTTYPSGLTVCALASFGASAIFNASVEFLALASHNASATFQSGINTSGPNFGTQPSIQGIIQANTSGLAGSVLASIAFSTLTGKVVIMAHYSYTAVGSAQINVDGAFVANNSDFGPSNVMPIFAVASGLAKSNHIASFLATSAIVAALSNAVVFDVQ